LLLLQVALAVGCWQRCHVGCAPVLLLWWWWWWQCRVRSGLVITMG
jgi:hypothetical protein